MLKFVSPTAIMNRKKSTYRSRRRPSLARRLASTHPIVAIAAIALVIFIAWRTTAAGQDRKTCHDTPAEALLQVAVPDSVKAQILNYTGFTVSFNKDFHQPNYVAWELTADETNGSISRNTDFASDPDAKGCPTLADYRRSGFDRGHMIPAADVKWSREAMIQSHFLTNISPQDHRLNAGAWATLESNCRTWARRDSAIIIITGPILTDRLPRSIGSDNSIPVPERFFKVVLSPFSAPPRGIAFIMNNGNVKGGVQTTATTIDNVETITGFDFFSALPDEIENEVEQQCEYHIWQRKTR